MSERIPQARPFELVPRDRGALAARTALTIVGHHLSKNWIDDLPSLHEELADYLRDEFAEVAQQTLTDTRADE